LQLNNNTVFFYSSILKTLFMTTSFQPSICTLMGHSSRAENIILCLGALESILSEMGADINTGVALSVAQQSLSS